MSLIGLDLNATRARGVFGPAGPGMGLSLLRLDGDQAELPLALSLEDARPRVGRPGVALARRRPHLACLDFLPHLGTGRVWSAGRRPIDADAALGLVLGQLARGLPPGGAAVACVPAYLGDEQLGLLASLSAHARLRLLGSAPAPLAAVLAAYGQDPGGWPAGPGAVLVVDADGHALTWSLVERASGRVRLRFCQAAAHLGRGQWLRGVLDGAAHRCVRQSRRDPRESGDAEQALYEQILAALAAGGPAAPMPLRLGGQGWDHLLTLAPEDLAAFVRPLLQQVLAELQGVQAAAEALGGLAGAVVTAAAAALPGLTAALESRLDAAGGAPPVEGGDYGDHLVAALHAPGPPRVLRPDALAAAAHDLAARVHRGEARPGHLEAVPLGPAVYPADPGPARLNFRGQDHVLSAAPFTLGRDPACDLVFESELYPHVSARHCEILYDRRAYMLCDRSRYGTLLNDRQVEQAALHPGDWIRLGPHGPVLRFLQ
jgi:hypothetical protein